MSPSNSVSRLRKALGWGLIAVGVAVFAVRLQHDGAYAMPGGGNLVGGLGSLALGGLLLWSAVPRPVVRGALVASPVALFLGLYAVAAELEEVVSLYATDSAGRPAELRLWIVDREDGAWLGMPRAKALEHSLDGKRHDLLRAGETLCVVPVLHEDRPTVRAIHALKMEKYAVARGSAALGLYPSEAKESTVALRVDPCPTGRGG